MVNVDCKKIFSTARELVSRPHVQLTLIYALCFGILGSVMSGMGPSLPELGRRTNSTDDKMGWVLGVRAFGYFAGSMGGPLYDHLPGNYVLVIALAVCSVSCALVGFIQIYGLLFLVVPFQGICMGLLDTGGNVMTLWLHPKDPEPYMQSLHFAFAIGGLISPLLIGQVAKHYNGSITPSWIVIALLFIPAIILLLRYESPKEPPRPVTEDGQTVSYTGWPLFVLIGTAAFLFFDIGAEASVATYLVTYAIRRNLSDEPTATLVNSLFWVFMVAGRLIAIPVSTFIKSSTILICSSILTLFSTLLWFVFYKSFAALTFSMILYGLGMSVAFATGVLLAQSYIPISGRAGTVFVVGAACGEFIIPISLSQLFPATNYMSLPMFMVGSSIVCLLLVFLIMWAGEQCPKTMAAPPRKELDVVSIEDTETAQDHSESTSTTAEDGGDPDSQTVKLDFEPASYHY
jgi:fucose permease